MTEINITISVDILNNLYREFVEFIEVIAGEKFLSFKNSVYLDEQENYKYSIYQEAKRSLGNKDWKPSDIGTGKIQKAVNSALLKTVIHNNKTEKNNLIFWMQKDNFFKLDKDESLEQLFFDFYKNKISPQKAFQEFTIYFDYQLIAYLFFINNKEQFLPISQKVFDKVILDKLQISGFKTSGNVAWDNYKTFIDITKQTQRFLRTKDKDATLLDAHSFLWILGKQREDWLQQSAISKSILQVPVASPDSSSNTQITKNTKEKRRNHFFQYWLQSQVESDMSSGENLRHAGSDQFKRRNIKVGDVVWVVTVKSDGQLYLVGKMVVDSFADYNTALEMFDNDVIKRDLHIVVNEVNSEPFKEINLMDVVNEIRFNSEDKDRLKIENGRIDPRQLQTIRELTFDTVSLILSKWDDKIIDVRLSIGDFDKDEFEAEEVEEDRIKQQNIIETEKEQLIIARRGQGKFRTNLEQIEKGCRLTGVKDSRFLIASHIKPWKESTNDEKLDGNNGLLLSPHVDKLFDRGWISFTDDGEILCANNEVEQLMNIWGLDSKKPVGNFNEKQKLYLSHHRSKFKFDE